MLSPVSSATISSVSPLRGEWIEIGIITLRGITNQVSPLRGEWIEIIMHSPHYSKLVVSPLRGEWIEIMRNVGCTFSKARLASQRRVD